MAKKKVKEERTAEETIILIHAEYDEGSYGEQRQHFVFPDFELPDAGIAAYKAKYEVKLRALEPAITGGVYIKKGTPIPDSITIVFPNNR